MIKNILLIILLSVFCIFSIYILISKWKYETFQSSNTCIDGEMCSVNLLFTDPNSITAIIPTSVVTTASFRPAAPTAAAPTAAAPTAAVTTAAVTTAAVPTAALTTAAVTTAAVTTAAVTTAAVTTAAVTTAATTTAATTTAATTTAATTTAASIKLLGKIPGMNVYTIQQKENNRYLDAHTIYKDGWDYSVFTSDGISDTRKWIITPISFDKIKIFIPGVGKVLTLATVKVLGRDGSNLIQNPDGSNNGTAKHISTYKGLKGLSAKTALDGKKTTITHTNTENKPWWEFKWNRAINLSDINEIQISNGGGKYSYRINGAQVQLLLGADVVKNVGIINYDKNDPTKIYTLQVSEKINKIKISLPGDGLTQVLTLTEVKVIDKNSNNLLIQSSGRSKQSSTFQPRHASNKAYDNDIKTQSHTIRQLNPYWSFTWNDPINLSDIKDIQISIEAGGSDGLKRRINGAKVELLYDNKIVKNVGTILFKKGTSVYKYDIDVNQNVFTIQQKVNNQYLDAHGIQTDKTGKIICNKNDCRVVTRNGIADSRKWIITPTGETNIYTIQQKINNRYLDAYHGGSDALDGKSKNEKFPFGVFTNEKQDNNTQKWIITRI